MIVCYCYGGVSMPDTNLKIYVDFTTWDTLTDPQKSLINFFMKDAVMVFRGDYQEGVFQYMSGNVRNKYYSLFMADLSLPKESIELNISYSESGSLVPVDGFPDGISTIIPLQNTLELLCIRTDSCFPITPFFLGDSVTFPVTLTPKSGETVINRPRLRPENINTNYNHIVTIPIETEGVDFQYDFQIRTSSFYIDDGSGNIDSDVFYKIGICPKEGSSIEDVIELLKENKLYIKAGEFLHYKLLDFYLAVGKEYTPSSNYKFVPRLVFPLASIENNIGIPYGIAYIELYNQDGTPFNQDISDTNIQFYLRPSENEEPVPVSPSSGIELLITDQSLDQGFILTPLPVGNQGVYTIPYSATDGENAGLVVFTDPIEVEEREI